MKIHINQIPEEGRLYDGEDGAEIMDLTERDVWFEHPVIYKLFAQVRGDALWVTGQLATMASARCGRCLKTVTVPLAVSHFAVHRTVHADETVDLTAAMREDIILELPQRVLCHENCKGLCPVCGEDLNVRRCGCRPESGDLRWKALDKIQL
jgi:uncharacterized protein